MGGGGRRSQAAGTHPGSTPGTAGRAADRLSIQRPDHKIIARPDRSKAHHPMATGEFRIFLSAVTSEFGKARDALAADLRSRAVLVKGRGAFRQEADADTTLRKLHDYIRDCSAVICIIGTRSGACPPPAAAAPFAHMLLKGTTGASYTQWEFFFARHYRRRLSLYIGRDHVPDQPMPTGPDVPDLQQALVRHIVEEQGLGRSSFSNVDQLVIDVLTEDWPKRLGSDHSASNALPHTENRLCENED